MNNFLGVGISLAIIVGIIIVATTTSMSSNEEIIEDISLVGESPIEETVEKEVESEGRDLTVELEEKIGFKNS